MIINTTVQLPKRVQRTENSDPKFKATAGRFDSETTIANILEVWNNRTEDTETKGVLWYGKANYHCQRLSESSGYSIKQICALVAVLSPMMEWSRNLEVAYHAIEQYELTGEVKVHMFNTQNRKATQILDGDCDVFNGKTDQKTFNFFHNMLNPLSDSNVTIDSHAFAIGFGMLSVSGSWTNNPAAYTKMAKCYRTVAERVGVLPCELQAITWETRKHLLKEYPSITSIEFAEMYGLQ